MNLIDLNEYLKDDEKAFSFLIKHKLIDNERKCYSIDHECNMFLIKHNQAKGGFLWKCPICSSTRTIFGRVGLFGIFCEGLSNIKIRNLMKLCDEKRNEFIISKNICLFLFN